MKKWEIKQIGAISVRLGCRKKKGSDPMPSKAQKAKKVEKGHIID